MLKTRIVPIISRAGFYFLLATTILAISFLVYFNYMVTRLEDSTRAVSDLYAAFYSSAASPESGGGLNFLFDEVIPRIDFPIILTDSEGNPSQWKGLELPMDMEDPSEWFEEQILRMDNENPPIEMRLPPDGKLVGSMHYGASPLTREVRWVPRLILLLAFLYLFSAFISYRSHRAQKERSVWIGMARETAHQLGTPLMSLMAWSGMLAEKAEEIGEKELGEVASAMEVDIERLSSIADRFEKIGVQPRLAIQPPGELLHRAVDYFNKRIPAFGSNISIRADLEDNLPLLDLNRVLFGWVLEIVLNNSLEACIGVGNVINVINLSAFKADTGKRLVIRIVDDGKGMTKKEMRNAFTPGFTTKRSGWGMGLPLASRIIEEYHGGMIYFVESLPGKGATLEISLPVPEPDFSL